MVDRSIGIQAVAKVYRSLSASILFHNSLYHRLGLYSGSDGENETHFLLFPEAISAIVNAWDLEPVSLLLGPFQGL